MTRFQRTLRSNSFSRSLVDSSCPNHQTPCWETVERYECTKTHTLCTHTLHLSFSLSLSLALALLYLTTQGFSVYSQQKYIQHHNRKYNSFYCPLFFIRLLIHLSKWKSSVCQLIAARNRQELLMTTVSHAQITEQHCKPNEPLNRKLL